MVTSQKITRDRKREWMRESMPPAVMMLIAIAGWWWLATRPSMSGSEMTGSGMDMAEQGMTMTFVGFLVAWVVMMTAMMFPATAPVVRIYARAAAQGRVAPVPFFVVGYLAVWSAVGLPGYVAWQQWNGPIQEASPSAARVAGIVALLAAVYQLTPLKQACLAHCRSPLGFFLHHGKHLDRPVGAMVAGLRHGVVCLGCCWMLMGLMIALGAMNLVWMVVVAIIILIEKTAPHGRALGMAAGMAFAALGVALLVSPGLAAILM
ncbi:DUF2182 domain-containing protein [Hoyosella sp. G463]|uniref:DUF2182 domain-containing protein n=1 Tax=Lolliginicoccus lacisalsi TaxID=2742202 RepID=A0A927PL34_9ACTN|nr:DUF2182 domain-containing protein [Lolliginicoccus lacisalsi]MBD8504982.1 DUF2182 domain-containing protein [Lolliginicoccus lacisalsi]